MKIILSYSGGLDSTVLLWLLKNEGHEVRCLTVGYGQRHKREIHHAIDLCAKIGVDHKILSLDRELLPILSGSSQTSRDIEVPEGHYTDETMKQTVVPNRNMILLSLATAWAISTKSHAVAYAAHAGDHAIYPDCREEFINPLSQAIRMCDWHKVDVVRPFIQLNKAAIVEMGERLQVPMHLTWSCYKGGNKHCGKCGTCAERIEAFELARVMDLTEYE